MNYDCMCNPTYGWDDGEGLEREGDWMEYSMSDLSENQGLSQIHKYLTTLNIELGLYLEYQKRPKYLCKLQYF
jgi:hypothetical protein